MRKKLLFITKGGEDSDNGLNYVIELARTLKAGVAVMLVFPKQFGEIYENIMAAITFAEAGEHKTSLAMMEYQDESIRKEAEDQAMSIMKRCAAESIPISCHVTHDDPISAIRTFVKGRPSIEMVLISPNLSQKRKDLNLRKLLKQITKPVVTISMPQEANA